MKCFNLPCCSVHQWSRTVNNFLLVDQFCHFHIGIQRLRSDIMLVVVFCYVCSVCFQRNEFVLLCRSSVYTPTLNFPCPLRTSRYSIRRRFWCLHLNRVSLYYVLPMMTTCLSLRQQRGFDEMRSLARHCCWCALLSRIMHWWNTKYEVLRAAFVVCFSTMRYDKCDVQSVSYFAMATCACVKCDVWTVPRQRSCTSSLGLVETAWHHMILH